MASSPSATAPDQQVMSPGALGQDKITSTMTIPKLIPRKPFRTYKLQMLAYLRQFKLDHVIEDIEEHKVISSQHDSSVFSILVQSLSNDGKEKSFGTDYLDLIASCDNSGRNAWKMLVDHFTKRSFVDSISLLKKLITSKFDPAGDLKRFISNFKTLASDVESTDSDLKLGNKLLSVILLMALPSEYDPVVSAIGTMNDLSIDAMISILLSHESRIKEQRKDMVYMTKLKPGSSSFKRSRDESDETGSKKIKGKFPSQYCDYCKCYGHGTKYCFKKKEAERNGSDKGAGKSFEKPKESVSLAINKIDSDYMSFCLDSGATSHMINTISMFASISYIESDVQTANVSSQIKSLGKGTVRLSVTVSKNHKNLSKELLLHNVLYVPNLSDNIISLGVLLKEGFELVTKNSTCQLAHSKSGTLIDVCTENNIFVLYAQPVAPERVLNTSTPNSKATLTRWHQRLGHPSLSKTHQIVEVYKLPLSKEEEVNNPLTVDSPCDSCVKGKHSRKLFPNSLTRANNIIELLHSDVVGPFEVPSYLGQRYRLTIICDKSRYEWNFCLKQRSEVGLILQKHILFLNNHFLTDNLSVKVVRSDNAKEYLSKNLLSFYESKGIMYQLSVRYSPQQNGVSERKNRTVVETARTLLIDSKLPKSCWNLALDAATYLVNRLPSKSLNGKSPHEVFFNKKPALSELKRFGCLAYYQVPSETRLKLDPKSSSGIFVGYPEHHKAYKIMNSDGSIIISRDVLFVESILGVDRLQLQLPSLSEREYDDNDYDPSNEGNEDELDDDIDDIVPVVPIKTRRQRYQDRMLQQNGHLVQISSVPYQAKGSVNLQELRRMQAELQNNDQVLLAKLDVPAAPSIPVPLSYQEALQSPQCSEWKEAILSELTSIEENQTWVLVDRPSNEQINVVSSKWVFTVKENIDGSIERFKARLVARGFSQKYGVDYFDTFSPVVNKETFRFMMTIASHFDYEIHTIDVSTAFLNGRLQEDIYMDIPEGYGTSGNMNGKVLKLIKSLYGLKQAPLAWYNELEAFLISLGFIKATGIDPCLFAMNDYNNVLYILVYVDDILLIASSVNIMERFKSQFSQRFKVRDLGEISSYLKLRIHRDRNNKKIMIDQEKYIDSLLHRFDMINCKDKNTPGLPNTRLKIGSTQLDNTIPYRECVGALIHIMTNSRPDIAFSVHEVCRYFDSYTQEHWQAVKRIMRYLKATKHYKFCIDGSRALQIIGFADSSFADDDSTGRRSTTGIVFKLGNSSISWASKKQTLVSTSTAESEYVALSTASNTAIWLRNLYCFILNTNVVHPVTLYSDNNACISIATTDSVTNANKHIELRFHIIKDRITRNLINVQYVSTDKQLADIMTKHLPSPKHQEFTKELGVLSG
jgi:hypothetical protein